MESPGATVRAPCGSPGAGLEAIVTEVEGAGCTEAAEVVHRAAQGQPPERCHLLRWAESGGMSLTGHADGPPLPPLGVPLDRLTRVARGIAALGAHRLDVSDPTEISRILFGRAALSGATRSGRTSPSGTCRLIPTARGWAAVNLARPSDVDAVGAVVGHDAGDDPWAALADAAATRPAHDLVERAQLVGIPAAELRSAASPPLPPLVMSRHGPPGSDRPPRRPVVVDLSAMWAGPLCAHLLASAGARVVKVESLTRPDGARSGDPRFFRWLHAGHESVVLDFESPEQRAHLHQLLRTADVVIEASRPRALEQLGIAAGQLVSEREGMTWVSITGYGRTGRAAHRVAFGDDAAVAGGMVARDRAGRPVFCGDALADPVAGMYAALGALASMRDGGGHLVDVPMAGAAAHAAGGDDDAVDHEMVRHGPRWAVRHGDETATVAPPPAPVPVPGRAVVDAGASTGAVLAELTGGHGANRR